MRRHGDPLNHRGRAHGILVPSGAQLALGQARVGPPAEVAFAWHQQVLAPVGLVWEEIASLDAILAAAPALTADVALGGRAASVVLHLRWGPLSWVADGHAALRQVRPPHHLLVVLGLPALALEYRGRVDLAPVGGDRTSLRYRGTLRCAHRYARRCPALLGAVVEDHVRAVAGIAKRRAEGHYLARVRLSGLGGAQATRLRPRRRPSGSSSASGGGRSVHAARLLGHVVSSLVEAPLHIAAPLTRRWG